MMSPVRYLSTSKSHILPISGLAPEELKISAKKCLRDREKMGHSSRLNLLVKSMGFKGGFAGYKASFEDELKPFMQRHGLTTQADLSTPRHLPEIGLPNTQLTLSIEQIAGRLFHSTQALPKRIFTGYNFRYDARYDDVVWEYNQAGRPGLGSELFWKYVNAAKNSPMHRQRSGRSLIDLIVGGHFIEDLGSSFNLIGDLLIDPVEGTLTEPKTYWPVAMDPQAEQRDRSAIEALGKLFRSQLDTGEAGWVEVIPFNEKLIFLKGSKGAYDFVFPGLRSSPFEHQIHAPYLKLKEIPRQMNEEYHFKRWYYFEFNGWREMTEHLAERWFYDQGDTVANYPGQNEIWKRYLTKRGIYQPSKKGKHGVPDCTIPFSKVQLSSKTLYVSELINIADLARFTNNHADYMENRARLCKEQKADQLHTMNQDAPELPAALTWYDACAFMADFETRYSRPVRLLTADEYLEIREKGLPGEELPSSSEHPASSTHGLFRSEEELDQFFVDQYLQDDFLKFVDAAGHDYGDHPPFMDPQAFQDLICRYTQPPQMIEHSSGLSFVDSDNFAEWLFGNAEGGLAPYVCSRSLQTIYRTRNFARELFPASSTGKYKHMKIGFRMCFEAI